MERLRSRVEARTGTRRSSGRQWKEILIELVSADIIRESLAQGELCVGIRDVVELKAARAEKLFTHVLWIERPGVPPDPTVTYAKDDCDLVLQNDGSLDDFHRKLDDWVRAEKIPLRI